MNNDVVRIKFVDGNKSSEIATITIKANLPEANLVRGTDGESASEIAAKIEANNSLAANYYGQPVEFSVTTPNGNTYSNWQIFYVGEAGSDVSPASGWEAVGKLEDRIYLISKEVIYNTDLPSTRDGKSVVNSANGYDGYMDLILDTTDYNGDGTFNRIRYLESMKLLWNFGYITTNTSAATGGLKVTEYLLDSNLWDNIFKEGSGIYKGYVDFAIGGPSVDLMQKSYQITHLNNYFEIKRESNIYKMKMNSDSSWDVYNMSCIGNDYEDLYYR